MARNTFFEQAQAAEEIRRRMYESFEDNRPWLTREDYVKGFLRHLQVKTYLAHEQLILLQLDGWDVSNVNQVTKVMKNRGPISMVTLVDVYQPGWIRIRFKNV